MYKGDYYVPPLHDEPGPGSSPILVQAFWCHMLAILLQIDNEVCERKMGTPDDKLGKKSLILEPFGSMTLSLYGWLPG